MLAEAKRPSTSEQRCYDIVERRILLAPRSIRKHFTSAVNIKFKIWSYHDFIFLLIDDEKAILTAQKRKKQLSIAFPSLISIEDESSYGFGISENNRKVVISKMTLDLGDRFAFKLGLDAGFCLSSIRIDSNKYKYNIDGTLFCLRLGYYYFEHNFDDAFDEMIAYHISGLSIDDVR